MTQHGNIRRAGLKNAAVIRDLTNAAYAKWIPVIGCEPKPMTTDFSIAVQAHMIDLLYEGDRVVGLIETVGKDGHLLIENVAVAPVFQGRGHCRGLLAHAETLAHSLNFTEIRLYTNSGFIETISLWSMIALHQSCSRFVLASKLAAFGRSK